MEIHRKPQRAKQAAKPKSATASSVSSGRDVQFTSTASQPDGPTPDFEQLLAAIQRSDVAQTGIRATCPPPARPQVEDRFLIFQPQTGRPYAVALVQVTGIAKMAPERHRGLEPVPPASARVLAGLHEHDASFLYLLLGEGSDVRLYLGVRATGRDPSAAVQQAGVAADSLQTCLKATYADIQFAPLASDEEYRRLLDGLGRLKMASSFIGNPSHQTGGSPHETTADQLIRALSGANYCLVGQAEPIGQAQLQEAFEDLTRQIAETHKHVKLTASASTTSVSSRSHEQIDRFAQHCEELLEIACQKVSQGLREGMWHASVTLLTQTDQERERASALLRSVFAGRESRPEPFRVCFHDPSHNAADSVLSFRPPMAAAAPAVGHEAVPLNGRLPTDLAAGPLRTALCSSDLGLLTDLPRKEAPGYRVTQPREFALDVESRKGRQLTVGTVLGPAGRTNRVFGVDLDDLTRHALVVGVTGSGKTNTALHLLNQVWVTHRIPFLVIEPAKAQYRNLLATGRFDDLQIFAPGLKRVAPFRINPFEFPSGIDPQAHISHLYTVFNAAFILYAPMPYVLERALYEVYEDRGWDLGTGNHPEHRTDGALPPLAFPTLTDLYFKIGEVVDRLGYDDRIRMDVTAGLQARVDSLRVGQKGQTFDCRRSVPFDRLLSKPTILELSHLGSDDERAFLMGLLLMRLYEIRTLAGEASGLQHVTLIEEAHRLLAKTSTDTRSAETANTKGQSVEAFCNILAEIRAYGEGLVVAEQIPTKLATEVLKNTNLKIMHRIVASDDREIMGGTMNLDVRQKRAVTSLQRGQAAVFAEGLEQPALVAVPLFQTAGIASDDDVQSRSEDFYRAHPHVLGQMAGCVHCRVVCRHGAWAKRLATEPSVRAVVWGYALSCLRDTEPAINWEQLVSRLLPSKTTGSLETNQRSDLAWCTFSAACELAFWSLRPRGVKLDELESLLTCAAHLADATRRGPAPLPPTALANFRWKIAPLLEKAEGPWQACSRCTQPCLYEPLGGWLAGHREHVERLRRAYQEKDLKGAVGSCCRRIASQALLTTNERVVEELAICFLAHVAERVGPRDPSRSLAFIFGTSTDGQ